MSFGALVGMHRELCGVSTKRLAKRMGIDPVYLEEIENDEVKPEKTFIAQLSDVLCLDRASQYIFRENWVCWKRREERLPHGRYRCHACLRIIAEDRAIGAFRPSNLNDSEYKKVAYPFSYGEKGKVVFLGTTCARKYGIVYTDDDW